MEKSPWMCHICNYTSDKTESEACELCYRVACELHLKTASIYNEDSGLYITAKVCVECGANAARQSEMH